MTQWRESPSGERQYLASDGYWYAAEAASQPSVVNLRAATPAEEAKVTLKRGSILGICAGALIAFGAFLPWETVHGNDGLALSLSRNALQMGNHDSFSIDGACVLAMGFLIIAVGITRLTYGGAPRILKGSALLASLVALVESVWLAISIQHLISHACGSACSDGVLSASIGVGAWLAISGSALGVLAALIIRSAKAQAREAAAVSVPT